MVRIGYGWVKIGVFIGRARRADDGYALIDGQVALLDGNIATL